MCYFDVDIQTRERRAGFLVSPVTKNPKNVDQHEVSTHDISLLHDLRVLKYLLITMRSQLDDKIRTQVPDHQGYTAEWVKTEWAYNLLP